MTDFIANYGNYIGVAVAFLVLFEKLARITPNETDNKIVGFLGKLFAFLGAKVPDIESIDNGKIITKTEAVAAETVNHSVKSASLK